MCNNTVNRPSTVDLEVALCDDRCRCDDVDVTVDDGNATMDNIVRVLYYP